MEFEGLLLRKAELSANAPLKVAQACVRELKRCHKSSCEDLNDDDLVDLIKQKIQLSASNRHVFENPKKKGQLVAYAELWGTSCWFVLSDPKDGGVRIVITFRMHRDRDFGEEIAQVREE